jgi:hypothetical protein
MFSTDFYRTTNMEAPEVPTEHLHEEMHHHAHKSGVRWTMMVALSSALLAGLAAVTSLLAGHHANEAMVEQISSANQWSYFQSKSIKESLLITKSELLAGLGKETSDRDKSKLEEYRREKDEIMRLAKEKEAAAEHHLHTHVIFARGVTLFQVAIAVGAISVLTHQRKFWYVSLAFGVGGIFFLTQGVIDSNKPAGHGDYAAKTESSEAKPSGH